MAATKAELARAAHKTGDVEASRTVHTQTWAQATESHGGIGSDFIKSIVFGGLDGIITTFSTIASVAGGSLGISVIITLGFANLIADGISMGVGDGLSSQAEADFLTAERKREEWEFDNYPEGEKREMVEILKGKGFEHGDATELIDIMATKEHRDFFIEYMMVEEIGEQAPDDPWGPTKDGAMTFLSFLVFGSVPMWVYVITYGAGYSNSNGTFGIAAAATVVTLYALGALQGAITRQSIIKAGLAMTINGSMAAAAAYLVSWGILQAIGNGEQCA